MLTYIYTEIFVRFQSSQYNVTEDVGSFDVLFEVVREESTGVYVPASYTFNFNLSVIVEPGLATGKYQ